MHPLFLAILIACAFWFFWVVVMAGRGVGVAIGFAFVGAAEFFIVFIVLGQVMKNQDFFLRAIRSGPDLGPILTYIAIPSVGVVFVSGLWLKKILSRPSQPTREQ
ncbi:MAG TPA: hypothetical protein PKH24_13170 [Sedimentisphaerales bacterium]|jgi:hypothetical protein|nr:hypothetical protein [Sedimentisphaerales bacterium]HNU29718.1 hypothetical protein [Sedimentisphaerales bacterium]